MSRERQQALGIFNVPTYSPDYCKLASDIVQQVWRRDTRGSPFRSDRIPKDSTLSFWKILAGFIEQASLAIRRRPAPVAATSNIGGQYQGMLRMINREIRAARGLPEETAATCAGPDQHILEVLEPDERTQWAQLPEADRARLIREFRGGSITSAGRSYLRKKVQLLAPGPDVQGDAQPAAVSDSIEGKG